MVSLQATIALATIGIYLVIMLALGYRGWQVGKLNLDDWMAASRGLGIVVLLFTFAASYHSAFAFLGIGGFIYSNGIGILPASTFYLAISGIILWIVGTRVWLLGKKFDYITPSDLLSDFYESPLLGKLVSLSLIVFTFPYIAVQLIGSGIIFKTATEGVISFEVGAAIFLIVGVIYVWLGGLRAVAWTDVVQGVFMFGAMWIAGWYFVFSAYQGPQQFWTQIVNEFGAYVTFPGPAGAITPAFYFSFAVMTGIGVMMTPHIFIRFISARSPRVLKWVAAFGTAYLILFYVPTAFLALGAVDAFPNLAQPDSAIPSALYRFTPSWFASIVVAGAVAAAMSTADSQMHAISALITRDWYQPLAGEDVDDRTATRFGQYLIPILGIISYIIAIQQFDFIILLTAVTFYGCAQIFPLLLGALYWERASREGALTGFILGILVTVALEFGFVTLPTPLPEFVSGFYGLIINTVMFIGVSLVTSAVSDETRDRIQGYIEYATARRWQTDAQTEQISTNED
ncbi:sodium:solute symporter family protein [Haladaptatus halobius]|jgi:solute:Na+ symporter, SSS family|uniref:sodium:solute symporter family protein n=1 Tax=Haladaptatus halobius TaxID=2884875 RepID=UPI001D0BAFF5|nr:sodium:solute symporter family protein [Haladaptatus halobius]